MKINFTKIQGGVLSPYSDEDADKMKRFMNFEVYEIDIKLSRNPQFHRKVFAFFNHCFVHWSAQNAFEFFDQYTQYNAFRKMMTIKSGYYDQYYDLEGNVKLEAKSLSYASMKQDEFESFYSAIIDVALKHIFLTDDQEILNKLTQFFN